MHYVYKHEPISFVLNWCTPTPTASDIKRNVQRTERGGSGELALMNVIHQDSVKLDSCGRVSVSRKMKEGSRKRTHRDMAVVLWTMRLMSSRPSRSGVGKSEVAKATAAIGTRAVTSRRLKVK